MRTAFAVVALAAALAAGGCTDEAAAPRQAADFSVQTFDGTTFTLSDHLAEDGRPVFLNLWAAWCAPCRAEMPDIDEASTLNPDVAFIGVAVKDELSKASDFADEIGVSYLLAFDTRREVEAGYDPIGLPATYIISSEGLILERIFGPLTGGQIDEKLANHFG